MREEDKTPAIEVLRDGDTLFVSREFLSVVDACAASIPEGIQWETRWVPTDVGWMWLDQPLSTTFSVDGDVFPSQVEAIGWRTCIDGWMMYFYEREPTAPYKEDGRVFYGIVPLVIREGAKLQRSDDPTSYKRFEPWLFSLFYLMAQPIMQIDEHEAGSVARSSAKRKGLIIRPNIRVVTLRRTEHVNGAASVPGHRDVEWSCRWTVGANFNHWRRQYFPSTQTHKWVHIAPYIKGPADKPLKAPAKTFYRVVR